jgi:hypothetical protein
MAVQKWRHYPEHGKFIIKTDHESLKYRLEQRINSSIQKRRAEKFLCLNYEFLYRSGKENVVVDALSRRDEGECLAISMVIPEWIKEVLSSYEEDTAVKELIAAVLLDKKTYPNYECTRMGL